LERLPVVSSDLPPVGGIGASGIHLDALALGTTYDEGGCSGHDRQFSVRRGDRVSVCFRVIHPRKEETMVVVWQKDGKTVRRTKLTIEPTHSYKTRAHLKVRRDHIGSWQVRLFSRDRTELGAQTFEVVR
jgi:hypothetical protein